MVSSTSVMWYLALLAHSMWNDMGQYDWSIRLPVDMHGPWAPPQPPSFFSRNVWPLDDNESMGSLLFLLHRMVMPLRHFFMKCSYFFMLPMYLLLVDGSVIVLSCARVSLVGSSRKGSRDSCMLPELLFRHDAATLYADYLLWKEVSRAAPFWLDGGEAGYRLSQLKEVYCLYPDCLLLLTDTVDSITLFNPESNKACYYGVFLHMQHIFYVLNLLSSLKSRNFWLTTCWGVRPSMPSWWWWVPLEPGCWTVKVSSTSSSLIS